MHLSERPDGNLRIVLRPAESLVIQQESEHTLFVLNESEIRALTRDDSRVVEVVAREEMTFVPSIHQEYLQQLFSQLEIKQGICVDIGAFDGLNHSHSLALYQQGWQGLSVECQPDRFARLAQSYRDLPQVDLARQEVSPASVVSLLRSHQLPERFDFLSLDIDSYDYYVLKALLTEYRPTVILTEINEVIPPPLRFAVEYDPNFKLDLNNRFYGQSLSLVADLAEAHNYVLLKVHANDVFLIDAEFIRGTAAPIDELFSQGVKSRPMPAYYVNYPFDVARLWNADPAEAMALITAGWPDRLRYKLSETRETFTG